MRRDDKLASRTGPTKEGSGKEVTKGRARPRRLLPERGKSGRIE
jgi:hypothetical protein